MRNHKHAAIVSKHLLQNAQVSCREYRSTQIPHTLGINPEQALCRFSPLTEQALLNAFAHHCPLSIGNGLQIHLVLGVNGLAEGVIQILYWPIRVAGLPVAQLQRAHPERICKTAGFLAQRLGDLLAIRNNATVNTKGQGRQGVAKQ